MIAIGCDHGGYELKQKILAHLRQRGLEYRDFGCDSTASVDYPVYGKAVAHAVASGECEKGIVICSTGIGISIAANKVPGIRCALCGDCFSAKATRLHNNANVLALGALVTGSGLALEIVAAKPYLHGLDRILLMTVCPGRGGQTYLEGSNQKIAGLRSLLDRVGSRAVIQIDGGVTPQNLPEAYAAGARSVVAGSAVFGGTVQSGVAYLRRSCAF